MDKEYKHRLILILEEQMFRVEDLCQSPDLSDETKVHEIRKSFKRMNALFQLFPETLEPAVQSFRQPMKALARRLTVARETTVNLQFLRTMCAENQCLDLPESKSLEQQLVKENETSLQELTAGESIFGVIDRQMLEGRHGFLEKGISGDFAVEAGPELEQSFYKARDLFLANINAYHPEEFHDLRKRMKVLWYQYEFIHPGQAEVPGTLSEKLHNITDRLGDDHDWYIFLEEIDHEKYVVSPSFKTRLESTIQRYQKANLEVVSAQLSGFFSESNNEFLKAIRMI